MANAGAPTKFTPERRRIVIETIRRGRTRKAAARAAGIGITTLIRWVNMGEDENADEEYRQFWINFQKALQDSQDKLLDEVDAGDVTLSSTTETTTFADGTKVVKVTESTSERKTVRAAMGILAAHFPDEYGDQKDVIDDAPADEEYISPIQRMMESRKNKDG